MGIEFRVRLIDLKRAFRRLITRLPDESETGADFIVFKADADHLEIVSGGTSETLRAMVGHPGQSRVPCSVFRGIARTVRFYRGKNITVASSRGLLRIARTEFRHANISVLTPAGGLVILGTKPPKPQNF
jgi:hypothetical protein